MTSGEHSSRPPRLYVTWWRCMADERNHAVTDEAFAHGVSHQQGRYYALCGHELLIDSCLAPPGRPCTDCKALVRIGKGLATRATERRRHPKLSRWRRIFGRAQTPAVPLPRPPQRVRIDRERDGRTTTSAGTGSASIAPVPAEPHARRGA